MATRGVKAAPARERVVERLMERRQPLIERMMGERTRLRGYSELDEAQKRDLQESVEANIDTLFALMAEGGQIGAEDIAFTRRHTRLRVLAGVTEADILAGLRMFQRVLWETIVEAAGEDEGGQAAALDLARPLLDYIDALSQACSEAFQDVVLALESGRGRVRAQLVEELLAGRHPAPGPRLDELRLCGLDGGELVVVTARALEPPTDSAVMPLVATTLARAAGGGSVPEPLAVARESGEVVVIRAAGPEQAPRLAEQLDEARQRLAGDGVRLVIGMSAVHDGPGAVVAGYGDACIAVEHAPKEGGLIALPLLRPLDYLVMRAGDRIAWRLVAPEIRAFIEEDAAKAGVLMATLLMYLDCDMNVKLAAERLFMHPNTAHARLAKISEKTGCDLRRMDDLAQLVVAIRVHERL